MADIYRKLLYANISLTVVLLVVVVFMAATFGSPIQIGGTSDPYESLQKKLASHPELDGYKELYPTIALITATDLEIAKQNSLTFFENATEGDYLLQYPSMTLIYRIKEDRIISLFEQPKAPDDLLERVYAKSEAADHSQLTPRATKLDDQLLAAAKANNAEFFSQARSGDYLLEWDDLVLIYDYNNDVIVNSFRRLSLPEDFVQKLMAHPELSAYSNENPAITQLSATDLETAKQANEQLFAGAKAGDYLLQWTNLYVVYNYPSDKIIGSFVPPQAPADMVMKLASKPELERYKLETPRVSQISEEVLPQLKEQFPNIYANAKAGDWVVRYSDILLIYDYSLNSITDMFNLQAIAATQSGQ